MAVKRDDILQLTGAPLTADRLSRPLKDGSGYSRGASTMRLNSP